MENIIEVKNVKKSYQDIVAVNEITFQVKKGEFFGFLGPNGAGKSTTINMMCTMLKPTSGEICINGFDAVKDETEVRKNIGIIFQENTLDQNLTAFENMMMHCKYYKIPKKDRQEKIEEVLNMVALWDKKDKIVNTFSGGMKRRLEIARGMLHSPKVLFLDEPTIGLDPQTKVHIWEYMFKLKERDNTTIFLTTHHMDEVEACDRIAIMDHGKIIALDTPKKLKEDLGGDIIELVSDDSKKLIAEIKNKYNINAMEKDGVIRFTVEKGSAFMTMFLKNVESVVKSINIRQPTLNDVFLHLTGRQMRDE